MNILRSLQYRSFAFLWAGQTISRLGDSLYRIALSWWVLEKTGSAAAMGSVLIFSFIPMLIFLLIGGMAVDRFPRARIMLFSDVLRGIIVVLVALLAFIDRLEIWHIYIASIVFGFVSAFFQPAYVAIVPDVVPMEARPSANSLTALSMQITGIVGPMIGAWIVSLGGTSGAFLLDGISFFAGALCILPLLETRPVAAAEPHERSHPLTELREGWHAIITIPWLWITIFIAAFTNLTQSGPYQVGLPFLVSERFGDDVRILGWLFSAASVGSVLSALWLGHQTRLRRRGRLAYLGTTVWGLMLVVLGLPLGLPVLLLASFIMMVGVNIFNLIWTHTLQEMVPGDKLGRVSSIDMLGSFVLLPIGYGLAGWAIDLLGAQTVFIIGGAITALINLAALVHPAIRNLD